MAQAKKPAAKKTAAKAAPAPTVVEETVAAPVAAPAPVKEKWEYKDRLYEITSGRKPLAFTVPTVHSARTPLLSQEDI